MVRMATEQIADKRRMFELFTDLKIRATSDKDPTALVLIDSAVELWTKMLQADAIHDNQIMENVINRQNQCEDWLVELNICLDFILASLPETNEILQMKVTKDFFDQDSLIYTSPPRSPISLSSSTTLVGNSPAAFHTTSGNGGVPTTAVRGMAMWHLLCPPTAPFFQPSLWF